MTKNIGTKGANAGVFEGVKDTMPGPNSAGNRPQTGVCANMQNMKEYLTLPQPRSPLSSQCYYLPIATPPAPHSLSTHPPFSQPPESQSHYSKHPTFSNSYSLSKHPQTRPTPHTLSNYRPIVRPPNDVWCITMLLQRPVSTPNFMWGWYL